MGNTCNKLNEDDRKERELNKQVNAIQKADKKADQDTFKLLLLGTGESGKSTIFKQVKHLYGSKYTEKDLLDERPKVYYNINRGILRILKARNILGVKLENEELAGRFEDERYTTNFEITPLVATAVKKLWQDEGAKELWRRRNEFQVWGSLEYFVDNIDRIGEKNYVPTFQDVLQCRTLTLGVTWQKFNLFGVSFTMYDVGGQRGERKKWINCFDDVVTVMFAAAISEWDQSLLEDEAVNRIDEAVRVWSDIVNRESFQEVGFVLFMNKWDLFEKKLSCTKYKSANYNTDYAGKEPCEETDIDGRARAIQECAEHMRNKFLAVVEPRSSMAAGVVFTHFTTAIDTQKMGVVFTNSKAVITRKQLFISGLPY